jgi:hypothetical protein
MSSKRIPRLIQILDKDGFVAALQWIARDGIPFDRRTQLRLLLDVERQFKNAKRLAKKHTDPRITKAERLAVDRGATEGERTAARAAAERIRSRLRSNTVETEAKGWRWFLQRWS